MDQGLTAWNQKTGLGPERIVKSIFINIGCNDFHQTISDLWDNCDSTPKLLEPKLGNVHPINADASARRFKNPSRENMGNFGIGVYVIGT